MARIFLGIAIVLTLISAYFSYSAKSKLQTVRGDLVTAQSAAASASATQAKALADAKAAKSQAAEATSAKDDAEKALSDAKNDATSAKSALATATNDLDAAKKEIIDLKSAPTPAPAPVTGPDPVELAKQLEDVKKQLAEKNEIIPTLTSKAEEADSKAKALEADAKRRQGQLNAPGLEGKVLAVSPSWSFVVLNIGDRSGVVANSTLLIKRGSTLIGRLRVSTVEPRTSIADIVPGSTPKGISIQPGDRVIYSGS